MVARSCKTWGLLAFLMIVAARAQAADQAWGDCASQTPNRSIAGCTAVLARGPQENATNRAAAFYNRGNAYDAGGDLDRAIADYDQALRLNLQFKEAYYNRGNAYDRKGAYDRAIADFDEALRLNPKYAFAYNARATAYSSKGRYDRAVVDFDKALRLNPKYALAYNNRGLAHEAMGDLGAALADFRKRLELEPGNAQAAASIARIQTALAARQQQERPLVTAAVVVAPARPAVALRPATAAPAIAPARPATPAPVIAAVTLPVTPIPPPASGTRERRIALVIGNAHYASVGLLPNPLNDARAVARTLVSLGFVVTAKTDLTREQLTDALANFSRDTTTADWAIIYFSGHGIEMAGTNYLIPVDAKLLTDRAVGFEAIPLNQVMAAVDGAHKLRLIILDACRSNPFASRMQIASASRAPSRGLSRPPEPDPGELIVYAAREGEVASDGNGTNSPFTQALLKEIRNTPSDVRRLFDLVRDDVIETTGGAQHPFTYGSLPGRQDFLFEAKP